MGVRPKFVVLWLIASFAFGVLLINNGCLKYQRGGGFLNIETGGSPINAVYGTREAGRLGFIIFSDLTGPETSGSGGFFWKGQVLTEKGRGFRYQKYHSGLEINGTEYDFTNGRVFFVSDEMERLVISQLNIPLLDAKSDIEIKRLITLKELQKFINPG